jgi:hypothetical protein
VVVVVVVATIESPAQIRDAPVAFQRRSRPGVILKRKAAQLHLER